MDSGLKNSLENVLARAQRAIARAKNLTVEYTRSDESTSSGSVPNEQQLAHAENPGSSDIGSARLAQSAETRTAEERWRRQMDTMRSHETVFNESDRRCDQGYNDGAHGGHGGTSPGSNPDSHHDDEDERGHERADHHSEPASSAAPLHHIRQAQPLLEVAQRLAMLQEQQASTMQQLLDLRLEQLRCVSQLAHQNPLKLSYLHA